ncbi:hypothetical protein Tco_0614542 [Tanacetum coccineum]
MPVSRQHRSKHFMDESVDHLFAGPNCKRSTKKLRQYKRKPLEFQVGDRVMLKVSPRKDESLIIPMKELQLDDKLNFVEELVEIMDREIKQLK